MISRSCRLCAGTELAASVVRGIPLARCARCGFLQVTEQPTPAQLHELYGPGYFDHGKYQDEFALAKENERRLALVRSTGISHGSAVLDAGCARGDFIVAASTDYTLSGVDVAESAVAEARQRCPAAAARIHAGFLEEQSFEPESFDAIVLWDVIEHVWDPVATAEILLRWLKPGGHLVLSTPNVGAMTARVLGSYWAFLTVPEHLGLFSGQSMRRLLADRLQLRIVHWSSRGKWANVGFVAYKARRVAPKVIPELLTTSIRRSGLGRLSVYVPTGDIQYVIARKP